MLILGIETSCDETAAAIVKDGREMISSVVYTQIEKHKKWGGVIPEMASRFHLEVISQVISECLEKANCNIATDIDAIAVTQGPGLTGSLLVGANAAKTLAWLYSKPIIPVNHLLGHIAANYIGTDIKPPLICLLVSGGHTQIIRVDSYTEIEVIGESVDDAAGEAFDKVARLMGLDYPGGPLLDKLAQSVGIASPSARNDSASDAYEFKIPEMPGLDFSFSGLKTGVLRLKEKIGEEKWQADKALIAKAFQETVAEFLFRKVAEACRITNYNNIIIAGGVAANSAVRKRFSEGIMMLNFRTTAIGLAQGICERGAGVDLSVNEDAERANNAEISQSTKSYTIYYPPLSLCTDNAAMIAAAAYHLEPKDLGFEVYSR